ncbi:cupredoxin domain-containing protein [Planktotalea sp.]|uniref:cupredoxin domain-containing protein n=1 Tax=Planktotalea sp. TaxID=2029877 RepID=UPI003D6BB270
MTTFNRRTFIASTIAVTLAAKARADGHAKTHQVIIKGHAFTPASLTISPGDSVTFLNQDGAPHTATANNKGFDTKRLKKGESGTVKFADVGDFEYFCKFHRSMTGKITVE